MVIRFRRVMSLDVVLLTFTKLITLLNFLNYKKNLNLHLYKLTDDRQD